MRFLRLRLENWRNFSRVDVRLQQRAFITGPNASGKSNFLDAFRFLQDIASVGGGLQYAVAKRLGVSKIRCLAARRQPDILFEIDLGAETEDPEWTYAIRFGQEGKFGPERLSPILKEETVKYRGETILHRPGETDRSDPELLTQTHLQQVSLNRRFRKISEFLGSVRYLHVVPQLIRDSERFSGQKIKERDPYGGDFLEQIAQTPTNIRNSRLKRIKDALKVAVPQLGEIELKRDEKLGTPHLRGNFEHWRPRGAWQAEDQFSDGTLRLVGLLWAVLDGSGPLLLEEPELSLHPDVVRFIPRMLWRASRPTRRQIFVSTHSPDLLEDKGIAPDEVLLLFPDPEGTHVRPASDDRQVVSLLNAGHSIADAVLPVVAPRRPDQLALFGEG